MASTAVRAKGTLIKIATGSGGAKTVSDVVVGNPTIITATAHGLTNGDVVTATLFGGADAASINGNTYPVLFKTTNTIAIALDSTGLDITDASTAARLTPQTYTSIANVKDFSGFDGSNSEIVVTNFDSTAVEILSGLPDNGQLMMNLDIDNAAGQAACEAARLSGDLKTFKVILPSGTTPTATFTGFVKKFDRKAAVNGVASGSITIRITGAVVFS